MNLGIASQNASTNQFHRLLHRGGRTLAAPDIWPEMVTAKDNSPGRKIHRRRDFLYQSDKPGGRLSGVAAKLIDLVRRRFDQEQAVVTLRLQHACFQHKAVSRADRINADCASMVVLIEDRREPLGSVNHQSTLNALPFRAAQK